MKTSKNAAGLLALIAVVCAAMLAASFWGFSLEGSVKVAQEPASTQAALEPAEGEPVEAEGEPVEAADTIDAIDTEDELAAAEDQSAASLSARAHETAVAAALASERGGFASFVYLKRAPSLATGIQLLIAFVLAALILSKKIRVPEKLLRSKITYAVLAEYAILMVCLWLRPDFFTVRYEASSGMLVGSLITILNRSAEITIIAMGMTLVIALGGTDISVGALVAVAGALALKLLRWDIDVYNTPGNYTVQPFALVLLVPLAVCLLMGLFNGALVAKLNIQPIIATLILMVAGRGIAQISTDGKQFTTLYEPFRFIGQGSFLALPMPVVISAVVVAAVMLFTRKTAFGMFVESVGVNRSASRVSGLRSDKIILIVYMLTGLLSGLSGLIYSSRISSCDSNNAGLNYEMDAILAVVIGGTSMSGGKFSLAGTVIGSIIIRTIITFVYYFGITAESTMAFKALIIAVVIVLQSEPVRNRMAKRSKARKSLVRGEVHA